MNLFLDLGSKYPGSLKGEVFVEIIMNGSSRGVICLNGHSNADITMSSGDSLSVTVNGSSENGTLYITCNDGKLVIEGSTDIISSHSSIR